MHQRSQTNFRTRFRFRRLWAVFLAGSYLVGGVASVATAQQSSERPFEGVIEYELRYETSLKEIYRQGMPQRKTLYVKGQRVLTALPAARSGGVTKVWWNFRTGDVYFTLNDTDVAFQRRVKSLTTEAFLPDMRSYDKLAGEPQQVAGYDCEAYSTEYSSDALGAWVEVRLWVAPDLHLPRPDSLMEAAPTDVNLGRGRYGLPLKRELRTEDIELTFIEEAVRVERKPLPDSLFQVREQYHVEPFDPAQAVPLPK